MALVHHLRCTGVVLHNTGTLLALYCNAQLGEPSFPVNPGQVVVLVTLTGDALVLYWLCTWSAVYWAFALTLDWCCTGAACTGYSAGQVLYCANSALYQ